MTRIIVFMFLSLLLTPFAFADDQSVGQYKLASGDVVKLQVYGEPDLSADEIRLNDAGNFSAPFIGMIPAAGKTAFEVSQIIKQKLVDGGYLKAPEVTISAVSYREFYISGEVIKAGGYPYQPGLTVDKAVALAGGLTERASKKKITITRGTGDKRSELQAEFNSRVEPGDTITIDQGFF